MEEEKIKQIESIIKNLKDKNFGLYFFTLDTKGNPTAGVANIYEHVKLLNQLGYNAKILHEKNDYKLYGDSEGMGLADWLGEEYATLPHISAESQELQIGPSDFIIIPEIFANIMDQVKKFPCKKIVFCQNYDYLLELLPLGRRWSDYGFNDVITTTPKQVEYIKSLFPNINTHIIPVSIPSYFKDSEKPKIPLVTVVTRNSGDAAKIAKSFYLKYPMFKWVTFKELRGLPREKFAEELSKSCLAVWLDDVSGFGTFPLEAIESNTPVVGKIPNLIPEWMYGVDDNGEGMIINNGIWVNTHLQIPDMIHQYLMSWLEDSVPSDLLEKMAETRGKYSESKQMEILTDVYNKITQERIIEFEDILAKSLEEINNEVNK
jgi:hypothetical protein